MSLVLRKVNIVRSMQYTLRPKRRIPVKYGRTDRPIDRDPPTHTSSRQLHISYCSNAWRQLYCLVLPVCGWGQKSILSSCWDCALTGGTSSAKTRSDEVGSEVLHLSSSRFSNRFSSRLIVNRWRGSPGFSQDVCTVAAWFPLM